MTPKERNALGAAGREWTQKQFNFDNFIQQWDDLFMSIYEEKGSWEDRKGYESYEVKVY